MAKKPKRIELNDKDNDKSYGNGNQIVDGNGGDDSISGGGGNDKLYGGDGNDFLRGGSGDDRLSGGEGDDRLSGGSGDDTIIATSGNDIVDGGTGDDLVKISGNFADATVEKDGDGWVITSGEQTVRVKNVENFRFDDGVFSEDDVADKAAGTDGEPFVLTTAIDNVVGTAGNDSITGTVTGIAETETLQAGDAIDGGDGEDTLSVVVSAGAVAANIVPSLKNVETIDVSAFAGVQLNLINSSGVKNISATNGDSNVNVTNVAEIVGLAVSGTSGGGLDIDYLAATVAGLTDVQKVSITNASAIAGTTSVDVAGVETFDVTTKGTNNVSLTGSTLQTVKLSGDGVVNVDTLAGTVKTFDASANTGAVSVEFTGQDVTATGGKGDDTFDFGTTLTKADVVDGGEGIDTVRVTSGTDFFFNPATLDLSAAAAAEPFTLLKNVERVGFDGFGGVTVNGATFLNAAITHLEFNTAAGFLVTGDDFINNAGSARTYGFGTANEGAATFNMNGGSTTLNLEFNGTDPTLAADDGTDANVSGLTVALSGTELPTAVATINIESKGDLADGVFNETGNISAVSGSTISITGSGNFDIDSLSNSATVDASKLSGDFNFEGSQALSGVIGNNQATGADTVTLGTGQNVVTFSSAFDSGNDNNTTGNVAGSMFLDVITGFKAGANGDLLDFTGIAGDSDYTATSAAAQAQISALSGVGATLEAAANIAANALGVGDEWTAFTFQGKTYALYDAAVGATYDYAADLLVELSGVTVANLTDDNFA